MKSATKLNALLWKEFKEISRDKKLIATAVLLPLLSLPSIGFLTAMLLYYQPVVIALVVQDTYSGITKWFAENLVKELSALGHVVVELSNLDQAMRNTTVDIILVVPEGFHENSTSYDKVAYIEVIKRTGVSEERVSRVEQDIRNVVLALSASLSGLKIQELAERANVQVYSVEAIRNPIQVKVPVYVTPAGELAKPEDIIRPFIARLLILTFAFIVTPASSYIVDGIVGERERKTMEMLLASPAGLWDLFAAKIVAASVVGLIASLADIVGLLAYFGVLVTALGGWFMAVYDIKLVLLHALTAFLTILVTVSISIPFITRTRGIKTASNVAGLLSAIGLAFFVSGWMVDFYKLPKNILLPLMLVPYTHSVLVIQGYVYNDHSLVASSIGILVLLSIVILAITLKTLNREKVLLAS